MLSADPFTRPAADAVVVGTGRLTLDVIIRSGDAPAQPRSQAGGTCGNVLANLAYLGWQAYPLTDLGDDDPGRRFTNDLARWGVHLDLIRVLPGEKTPVIIHHIKESKGSAESRASGAGHQSRSIHSFSSRCPFCGQRLRYYEPLPVEAVQERLSRVPAARVCFFDRDSPGSILLARHCAEKGALIVFEPNYAGKETLFPDVLPLVHVLKYSREKLPNLEDRFSLREPLLLIETLGAEGLRYRDQRNGAGQWQHLPAFPVEVVRDAGGSGDWCTAGFIHRLGASGLAGVRGASENDVYEALRFGQALAAWGCAFEGARGAVYHGDRADFARAVMDVLEGRVPPTPGEPVFDLAGCFCACCEEMERG